MCKQSTKNYRVLEVAIPSTNQRDFYFPQDEILREARKITAIEAFKVGNSSQGPISGLATVNDTVFNKSFLSLQTMGAEEPITNAALVDLSRKDNNGDLFTVDLPPLNITKCRITVPTAASLSTSEVFLIGFHYEK